MVGQAIVGVIPGDPWGRGLGGEPTGGRPRLGLPCVRPRTVLRFLANLIWFACGGLLMGLGWWLAGLVAAITLVGIPWSRACFVIGTFAFWPFLITQLAPRMADQVPSLVRTYQ